LVQKVAKFLGLEITDWIQLTRKLLQPHVETRINVAF
jgi:hypothetical protein